MKAILMNKDTLIFEIDPKNIEDVGKRKYKRKKKIKSERANHRTHKIKEIKLNILTNEHDMVIKSKHIRKFLKNGLKTKVTLQFKGRQISFKKTGVQKINSLITPLIREKIAKIDNEPQIKGKNIVVFLTPCKEHKNNVE